jgi:4-amino-4-deoxy-L-arabinose transferase-like glycosyltransferase
MSLDSSEIKIFIGTAIAILLAGLYIFGKKSRIKWLSSSILNLILIFAVGNIIFVVFLWFNHINFPLNLESMELTMLQHVRRLSSGLQIYVDPSPDFVALAYNPLYYYLVVPFTWVFGSSLFTMRLVSILGMFGSGVAIYLMVRRQTTSVWYGLVAVGLFCAAYRVMDTYLDNAHSDSWLLFSILLGCYLISLNHSRFINLVGVAITIASFWFKQSGAIFVFGAVLYLAWREGWRKSWPYWLLACILGPGLYFSMPGWVLGLRFHYFTWEVPSHWIHFDWNQTIIILSKYLIKSYFWLALGTVVIFVSLWRRKGKDIDIYAFMTPFALLYGVFVSLDPGRNNNLLIPLGAWLIITGLIGLNMISNRFPLLEGWGLKVFILSASFALLVYNPYSVIIPKQATQAYKQLVSELKSLDGPVYAPWTGQLQSGYLFYPAVHWVAMTDLFRNDRWELNDQPLTRELLARVINPGRNAYILTIMPLEVDPALKFLARNYQLQVDFKEQFSSLTSLPKLVGAGYPRYLYRYIPN